MTSQQEQHDFLKWSQDWQAGAERDSATEEQIRHYVAKRGGFIYSMVLGDFIVGAIALPVLLYIGVMSSNDLERFAMFGLAYVTVAAVCFGWWNWRSVLRASANSVSEYVAISNERIRRMRLALRVGWMVLVAQVVLYSIWIPNHMHPGNVPPSAGQLRFAWTWLAGFTGAAAIGLIYFSRWLDRDAARFERLRRDLE
jgi:hypothetical protein